MKKEEILKKASNEASALVNKYRKEHAAMMAAVWRGDIPAWEEHRKVLEAMMPEVQATVKGIFSWAVSQLHPRYTGGAVAYGRGRGRVCMAPSYAAPVRWVDVEACAVIGAPTSWETYASPEEALRETISRAGNGPTNGVKIKVRDRPDPNDSWYSMTTVIEGRKTLDEAIKASDPKWGLTGFGQWEWGGVEISPETQAEVILLQGGSPFRGQWDGHKWQFDIAIM